MSVVNFAALPPEVNSGLMYSGSGSGPMVSAATAWDRLAAELGSAATSYREVISELTDGGWQGPSAEAMAAAAAPYVEWMNVTAAQAAQTASQARSAAAAYEAAFTATVPPPVIAANRALLSSLVSTNTFGQNTAAIAANQAQYAEMWAQDVTAMYSYVGNAAAAVQLTPFSAAPQDTNPAAAGAPAAAASQATGTSTSAATQSLGSWLHSIGSSGPLQSLTNLLTGYPFNELETINGTTEGFSFAFAGTGFNIVGGMFDIVPGVNTALTQGLTGMEAFNGAMAAAGVGLTSDVSGLPAGALSSTLAGSYGPVSAAGGAGVSAGLGRAAEVGALSVPQSWASASDIRLAAKALPAAGLAGLPQVGAAAPGLAGMGGLGGAPILGSVVDASRTGESGSRYGAPSKLLSGLPGKTGAADQSVDPAMRSSGGAVGGEQSVTEYDELGELRRIAAELAKERDELKRSANALIKRVTATRQLGP